MGALILKAKARIDTLGGNRDLAEVMRQVKTRCRLDDVLALEDYIDWLPGRRRSDAGCGNFG